MTTSTSRSSSRWIAKGVVVITGIAVFGAGIRWDSVLVRWIGIGVVAVAWALRFITERDAAPAAGRDEPQR